MICEIEFREGEKIFSSFPQELQLKVDDYVIFKIKKGEEFGKIIKLFNSGKITTNVFRKASPQDIEKHRRNEDDQFKLYELSREKAKEFGLPIKVATVHIQFDRSVLKIGFLAEKRVDLKLLMKELTKVFKGRIEVHQIGVRDYAKKFCAYGMCGRPICCQAFLSEFEPITLSFIKLQNLACGTPKLTGVCGRLMCCLAYESGFYKEAEKRFPRIGSKVETSKGKATVIGANYLKDLVKIQYEDGRKDKIPLDEFNKQKVSGPSSSHLLEQGELK